MENNYFSLDTGQDKTEQQLLWKRTISVLPLEKIKLNGNLYGELIVLFCHWTR